MCNEETRRDVQFLTHQLEVQQRQTQTQPVIYSLVEEPRPCTQEVERKVTRREVNNSAHRQAMYTSSPRLPRAVSSPAGRSQTDPCTENFSRVRIEGDLLSSEIHNVFDIRGTGNIFYIGR